MRYRVWCPAMTGPIEGLSVHAHCKEAAAEWLIDNLDKEGSAFPDDADGDMCEIAVAEWSELPEQDDDAPEPEIEHELVKFRLRKERRVVMV